MTEINHIYKILFPSQGIKYLHTWKSSLNLHLMRHFINSALDTLSGL